MNLKNHQAPADLKLKTLLCWIKGISTILEGSNKTIFSLQGRNKTSSKITDIYWTQILESDSKTNQGDKNVKIQERPKKFLFIKVLNRLLIVGGRGALGRENQDLEHRLHKLVPVYVNNFSLCSAFCDNPFLRF